MGSYLGNFEYTITSDSGVLLCSTTKDIYAEQLSRSSKAFACKVYKVFDSTKTHNQVLDVHLSATGPLMGQISRFMRKPSYCLFEE